MVEMLGVFQMCHVPEVKRVDVMTEGSSVGWNGGGGKKIKGKLKSQLEEAERLEGRLTDLMSSFIIST